MAKTYLLKGGLVATFDDKDNQARTFRADVLVKDGIIADIAADIPVSSGIEVVDCTDKWIAPGMAYLDGHSERIAMRVRRVIELKMKRNNIDQDHSWLLTEYLVKNSWNMQGDLTPSEIRIGQLAGCIDALQCGVTTILDHFHIANSPEHSEEALQATIESGARVIFAPARQSPPTKILPTFEFGNEAEAHKWQLEQLQEWGKKDGGKLSPDGRVTLGFAYDLVIYGFDIPHKEIVSLARSSNASIITAHVVQGNTILAWRDKELLGPDVVFSHCNSLAYRTAPDDEAWAAMKEHQCAIASTPEDELGMAHGNPVAFDGVDRGVKCGLGCDAVSINSGDMFTQMRFALQWHRGRWNEQILQSKSTSPKHVKHTSADAFRLATLGGAEALNMSHLIGTIQVGKRADIVIYDATSLNLAGIQDPIQGIVFNASNADVETVFVDGEIVVDKRVPGKVGLKGGIEWKNVAKELRARGEDVRKRWPVDKLEGLWDEYYTKNGAPAI